MNEKFSEEKGPSPENLEDQKYKELQVAMDKENRIMKEINDIFTNTSDRKAAEDVVLHKYGSALESAMEKSKESLEAWLDAIKKSEERFLKEEEKRRKYGYDKTGPTYIPEDEFSFKDPEEYHKKHKIEKGPESK